MGLSHLKWKDWRLLTCAVLIAEVVHHEQPRIIELHNYSNANSIPQKLWAINSDWAHMFHRALVVWQWPSNVLSFLTQIETQTRKVKALARPIAALTSGMFKSQKWNPLADSLAPNFLSLEPVHHIRCLTSCCVCKLQALLIISVAGTIGTLSIRRSSSITYNSHSRNQRLRMSAVAR